MEPKVHGSMWRTKCMDTIKQIVLSTHTCIQRHFRSSLTWLFFFPPPFSFSISIHFFLKILPLYLLFYLKLMFSSFPSKQPFSRLGYGRILFIIVKNSRGILESINPNFIEEIKLMKSFRYIEFFLKIGGIIAPTIDCFTFGGLVKLCNSNLDTLISDYDRIRNMEDSGFFISV